MPRSPGSQRRELMKEKEVIARRLMAQGLTERQICTQLNCSRTFLRRVRADIKQEQEQQAELYQRVLEAAG